MDRLVKKYLISSFALACATIVAQGITGNHGGIVYEAMRDGHEESLQDMHEYDSVKCVPSVNWPSVVEPFGFTPDYFNAIPEADPTDGVEMLTLPYSNGKGDLLLSLKLSLPVAHHHLQPILPISYNSSRGIGNLGKGWNLDIPQIEIDTFTENVYWLDGKELLHRSEIQGDTATIFFFRRNHNGDEFWRIRKNDYDRWEMRDGKGITYYFGAVDKDENLIHVLKDDKQRVLAWKLWKMENAYGDYVIYKYGTDSSENDSIFVGNPNQEPHTCILLVGYQELQKWGNETVPMKRYTGINILHCKEKTKKDEDKWENVHDYTFAYQKDKKELLASVISKGYSLYNTSTKKYVHSFVYYEDTDSVAKQRRYRDFYHNISLDSLIIDRTGLLKTVHMPLGGCFTVDYQYGGMPDTFGVLPKEHKSYPHTAFFDSCLNELTSKVADSIVADSAYKTEMIAYLTDLLDRRINQMRDSSLLPFDTLVQRYFDYTDGRKGKLVLSSLWTNDGIQVDGDPSRNFFLYERPYCDTLGRFLGFSKVETLFCDTIADRYMRRKTKWFDTTDMHSFGLILKSEIYEGEVEAPLKTIEYTWNKYSKYADFLSAKLKKKKITIGDYSYSFDYTYQDCCQDSRLVKIDYGNGETLQYTYDDRQLLTRMETRGNGFANSYLLEYATDSTRQLKRIREGENTTSIFYDKEGNIREIHFPVDANGDSLICTYLYDRKYNMFLERVENNLGYRTELEDYNYVYGKPSIIRDQNGFVMKQTFDMFGRLDTLLAPNEQDNGIPYSMLVEYGTAPTSVQDEEKNVIAEFNDSLARPIPPHILAGEVPEEVKERILQTLRMERASSPSPSPWIEDTAWYSGPYEGPNGRTLYIYVTSSDSSYYLERDLDTLMCTSSNEGTLTSIVTNDTIQIYSCQCDNHVTPVAITTKRYNAPCDDCPNRMDSIIKIRSFSDGFGRKLQTLRNVDLTAVDIDKNTKVKTYVWVTTEAKKYDPFGRVSSYCSPHVYDNKPESDPAMDQSVYNTSDSLCQYDALDRILSLESNGELTSYNYKTTADGFSLARVRNGNDTLEILGYNYRNQLLSREIKCSNARWSYSDILYFIDREKYEYYPIGKVKSALTSADRVEYIYDGAGRLLSEKSARYGTTTHQYDKAGNRIKTLKPDGESIEYTYNRNLLTQVHYSNHPESNVTYLYGDKNASFNRVGRLAQMVDETGVQEFFYGRQGEVDKVRRTLVIPNNSIETYTTQFRHDTWNRLSEVIYPDGEVVKYRYDHAGRLKHVWGEKAYSYNYVDNIGYDLLGNRNYFDYCNGNKTFKEIDGRVYKAQVWDKRGATRLLRMNIHDNIDNRQDSLAYPNFLLTNSIFFNNNEKERREFLIGEWESPDTTLYAEYYQSFDDSARLYVERLAFDQKNLWNGADTSIHEVYKYHYASPYLADYKRQMGTNGEELLNTHFYQYDKNGNRIEERDLRLPDPMPELLPVGGDEVRLFAYSPENKVEASNDNGYLETYWYDANGALSFRLSGVQSSVFVNGANAQKSFSLDGCDIFVNPYYERIGDSTWIKHIYIDQSPWVSKVVDNASFGADARRVERAGTNIKYPDLWANAYNNMNRRFQLFEVEDTIPMRNCPTLALLRSANVDNGNDNYESRQYYYHYDKDGNLLLITDLEGKVYQLPIALHIGKLLVKQGKEIGE